MTQLGLGMALGAGAFALIALPLFVGLVRAEARRRGSDVAALSARLDTAEARADRLALLDRRRAAIGPIDALWLGWTQGCRPQGDAVAAALHAVEEARLLFPAAIAGDLDSVSALCADWLRHQQWLAKARDCGRYDERAELLDREAEIEEALRHRVEGLRSALAAAARIEGT